MDERQNQQPQTGNGPQTNHEARNAQQPNGMQNARPDNPMQPQTQQLYQQPMPHQQQQFSQPQQQPQAQVQHPQDQPVPKQAEQGMPGGMNPAQQPSQFQPLQQQPQPQQRPLSQPQQPQQQPHPLPQQNATPSMSSSQANVKEANEGQDGAKLGAAHAKAAQSAFMKRSSRMRKLYVVVIVVLVIIVVAIGFLAARMIWAADNSATQQTQATSTDLTQAAEADDKEESDSPQTTVPNLVSVLGKTRKAAIKQIGHGAEVVSSRKVNEAGSSIKREVRLELTAEPSDGKSGAPTVYLSLNKKGKVVQVGYSAAIALLGYGSASFSDTIESEHIVENTLKAAGLEVELGSAVLPEDSTTYTSYSSDGSTVTKERCTFSGKGEASGKSRKWEAILSYDYTVANASDNLNDTLRTIYIYIR